MQQPYTIETLRTLNQGYIFTSISLPYIEKINKICAMIEANRPTGQIPTSPQDGDRIVCLHPTKGKISPFGYLEKRESSGLSICVHTSPDVFIGTLVEDDVERLYTSAGGGDWRGFTEEQFREQAKYKGEILTVFCLRDHAPQGTIKFVAKVYLWEVTDSRFH